MIKPDVFCQTSEDFFQSVRSELSLSRINRPAYLEFKDERKVSGYEINIDYLKNILLKSLQDKGFELLNERVTMTAIQPIEIKVVVDYLNFYENAAKNFFGKGILDILLADPDNPQINDEIPVAVDIPFNREKLSYKKYNKFQYQDDFIKCENIIAEALVKKVLEKIQPFIEKSKSGFREVVSYGKAPFIKDEKTAKRSAIYNALQEGCANAWGTSIENVTTVIDFADVEDITKGTTGGLIINYEIIKEAITLDNFYCVLVKSTIGFPK